MFGIDTLVLVQVYWMLLIARQMILIRKDLK